MMLRAELRGVDGQYSASIKDYDELLSQLPDSSKLRLGRARVLAFARDYDAALQELETLHTADPGNFEVLREAARFAFWGRRYSESLGYYDRLIAGVEKKPADQGMSELLTVVRLERQAKDGVLNGGADSAEKALVQLLELEPGNKEALFDLAQIHCARGRVSASVECYDRITTLAPLHRMAPKARAQILRRQNPTLHTGGYYRSEEGRGELARISKRHYFAATSLRSGEDWKFGLQANVWGEQPHLRRESFESFGPGFEAQRRIGRSSYGRAWINSRFYTEGSLGSRATGGVDGRFALDDWNELTAGYERIDEIFNRFGLEEELQSDNLWLNLKSAVQRDTEVTSELRVLRYTDSNTGMHGFVEIHHALTEFPGRFRLGGRGEFRHTDERNVFFSDQSGVVSIEHPYWTPQEYGAGFVFLDWHHELNDILFCEQNRHYYKVRFAPFSATDGNAGIDVTAEWSLELEDGLGFGIQLSTQQSRLYDAEQLSGVVRYNF
jgi:hypothetical protein